MSFPVGIAGGLHQHRWQNALAFGMQSLFVSNPNFWLAIVLILFLSVKLKLLPALGYQGFSYVILPALVLAVGRSRPSSSGRWTTSLGEVMQARSSMKPGFGGLSRRRIVYSHALRNAAVPLVNLLGIQLSTLIGGVLVIEYIFGLSGPRQFDRRSPSSGAISRSSRASPLRPAPCSSSSISSWICRYLIDPRVEI